MEEVEAELKIINISTNRTFTFLTCFLSIKTDEITHFFLITSYFLSIKTHY